MPEPLLEFTDDDHSQIVVTVDESVESGDWLPVLARILVDADKKTDEDRAGAM